VRDHVINDVTVSEEKASEAYDENNDNGEVDSTIAVYPTRSDCNFDIYIVSSSRHILIK